MTRQKTGRRFGAFLCALLLLCTLVPSAFAAQTKVQVNGQHYNGSVVVQNSTTYIPMRHFLNFLGWDVTWHASSNSAFANSTDGRTLHVGLATKSLTVDGYTVEIPVTVRSGRIYLPLRTLCTLMGYQVSWDGAKKLVSLTSAGGSSWTADELYWLSRIIYAEARGESLTGQIAVGNVVLNRVASPDYPDTIYEVIFDSEHAVQFQPVSDGTIYNTPDTGSIQAAKLALQGVNVAGSSLFFFNPALSKGTWIVNNRTYYKTIGNHQFYL